MHSKRLEGDSSPHVTYGRLPINQDISVIKFRTDYHDTFRG